MARLKLRALLVATALAVVPVTAAARGVAAAPRASSGCTSAPTASWVPRGRVSAAARFEIAAQASWILSAQLPDGAIRWTPSSNEINPYAANYAAAGLAVAYRSSHDPDYLNAAWSWLAWYAHHEQRGTGYVSDYHLNATGGETSIQEDSTDAYAGTFLTAAFQTWCADPRMQHRLAALRTSVAGAVHAIHTTQQANGLTWATPSYHAALLMDQSETWAGLSDAMVLARALHDRPLAREASSYAEEMHAGIQSLWDPATRAFDWAASGSSRQLTDWRDLYPDAMEQAWAIFDDVATPAQASVITTELKRSQPHWADPPVLARFRGAGLQPVGYWPAAAVAEAAAGHPDLAAVASISRAASAADRAWPWTIEDAGQLVVAESAAPSP